jgi:hypothetical protein
VSGLAKLNLKKHYRQARQKLKDVVTVVEPQTQKLREEFRSELQEGRETSDWQGKISK